MLNVESISVSWYQHMWVWGQLLLLTRKDHHINYVDTLDMCSAFAVVINVLITLINILITKFYDDSTSYHLSQTDIFTNFLWKVLFSFGNNDVTIAVFESHRSLWFRKAFWLFLLLTGWRHWVSMNYKMNSWNERGYLRNQNCFCWWLSTVNHWGTSGTWVTISKSIVIIMFQVKRLKWHQLHWHIVYMRGRNFGHAYIIYIHEEYQSSAFLKSTCW